MTTEQGNKLIAEFMGYKFNAYSDLKHSNITKPNEDGWFYASWELDDFNKYVSKYFKYHKSWSWLMPVVEKIELLGYSSLIERLYTGEHRVYFCSDKTFASVGSGARDNEKICAVWIAVISFIEWLNKETAVQGSDTTMPPKDQKPVT